MTISTDFRRKMILKLIEALKESPAFTNLSLDQIKEAVLNSEHQTFQQSKSSDEYLFYINEKLKKIKQSSGGAVDSGSEQMSVETKDEKSKVASSGFSMQAKMPQMYSQESASTVASVRKMNNFSSSFDNTKRQQENSVPDQNFDGQPQKTVFLKAEYRNSPGYASYNSNSYEQKYQTNTSLGIDHDQNRSRYPNNFDYMMKPEHMQSFTNARYQPQELRPESSNIYHQHSSAIYGNASQFTNDDSHLPDSYYDKRVSYQNSRNVPPHQPMTDTGSFKFEGFSTRFNSDMHGVYPGAHQGQYNQDSRSVSTGQNSSYGAKEFISHDNYLDKKIQNQVKGNISNQHYIDRNSELNYKSPSFSQSSTDYKSLNNDVMARGSSTAGFPGQGVAPSSLNTFTKKAVSYEYSYPKTSVPANNKSFIGNVNPSLYDHAMKKAETENSQSIPRSFSSFDNFTEPFTTFNRNTNYSKNQAPIDPKKSEELFRSFGTEFLKINKGQESSKSISPETLINNPADNKRSDTSSSPKFISTQEPATHTIFDNNLKDTKTSINIPAELQDYLNKKGLVLKQINNLNNWNMIFDSLYNKYKKISSDKIECQMMSDIETQRQHIDYQFLSEEDIQSYLKEIEKIENKTESSFDRTEYLKFIDKAIEAFSEKQNEEMCTLKNNEGNV